MEKKIISFLSSSFLRLRPSLLFFLPNITMEARRRQRQGVSLLSFVVVVVVVLLLPCLSNFAAAQQDSSSPSSSSSSSRLASSSTSTTSTSPTGTPSIPPLPRAEELCSLAKQYAVPLKLCSGERNGTLEIDKGSLLAAVAAVVALPSRPETGAAGGTAPALSTTTAHLPPPPQSLDALRQQVDQATIQAASYLAPPLPGSPEAAALAAAEKDAAAARDKEFKSKGTRGKLIGAAVSVAIVSVLLVILAGKKQKTGKWL